MASRCPERGAMLWWGIYLYQRTSERWWGGQFLHARAFPSRADARARARSIPRATRSVGMRDARHVHDATRDNARCVALTPRNVPRGTTHCVTRAEPTTRHAMRDDAQRCAPSHTSRHAHRVVAVPSQAPVEHTSNPSSRALLTPIAVSRNAVKQGSSQHSTGA